MLEAIVLLACFACAACAFYYAYVAKQQGDSAYFHANELKASRGRLIACENGLENLFGQHRKLAGRVYADEYWHGQREEQPQLDPRPDNFPPTITRDALALHAYCEQWALAQDLGPHSEAAKCECAYCTAKREEKRQLKARLIPKTAQDAAATAKLNGGR